MFPNENFLVDLPKSIRILTILFIAVLTIGFISAMVMLDMTTSFDTQGIEENYLGNELNEDAEVMKFKKSKYEIFNIVHTHIINLSMLFFILGVLTYGAKIPSKLKSFLILEPLVSVAVSFIGIYLLWCEILWIKYIIMISGILMTLCFAGSVFYILKTLFSKVKS